MRETYHKHTFVLSRLSNIMQIHEILSISMQKISFKNLLKIFLRRNAGEIKAVYPLIVTARDRPWSSDLLYFLF